jgi:hypothetical protein
VASYSERELRYARPVANAILNDPAFREWLLSGTHHVSYKDGEPAGDIQGTYRSKNLKNPYWFNYWCPRDAKCECRIGSGIETDIFLILVRPSAERLGLHLEIKRPGDKLRVGQAESYARRAACWANPSTRPKTVMPHDHFVTILIGGRELNRRELIRHFDKVIFHDEVACMIGLTRKFDRCRCDISASTSRSNYIPIIGSSVPAHNAEGRSPSPRAHRG